MDYREIAEFSVFLGEVVKDIRKDKNIKPIIGQRALCRDYRFVDYIKKFRKDKGIDYKKFNSLVKALPKEYFKKDGVKIVEHRETIVNTNDKKMSREKKLYLKLKKELKEIYRKISKDDTANIRNEFKHSPKDDCTIKKYILTNIMPNPLRYDNLNWKPILELRRRGRGFENEPKFFIQLYRDTTYEDIIKRPYYNSVEFYKHLQYKNKKRYTQHSQIEPIFDETNRTLRIPIYPDTATADIKDAWSRYKIKELQKKLPEGQGKHLKPYKDFEADLTMAKQFRCENSKYTPTRAGKYKKVYNRKAQRKKRVVERGYEKPFRKERVVTLTCKSCDTYKTCQRDERKTNQRCRVYKSARLTRKTKESNWRL